MRLARVLGQVVMRVCEPSLKPGRWLVCEVLDEGGLSNTARYRKRSEPMPQSLVVFDELGAGVGQIIAVSEGREAAMPFHPQRVPIDAYCAAIMDQIHLHGE